MWDKMQFLFGQYYDRTAHAVYYYDSMLDETALKQAYTYVVSRIPVLHSTFNNSFFSPYWKENEFSADDFFSFEITDDPEAAVQKFTSQSVPPDGKVQLRVRLIRSDGKDILACILNHMCADGSDMKYIYAKAAESYSNFKKTGRFEVEIKNGTRSALQVYDNMSPEDKAVAKKLYKNISAVKSNICFPLTPPSKQDTNRIIRATLSEKDFFAMKARGKTQGATVNDIILVAYFRALYSVLPGYTGPLAVPCMYDLRKYMKNRDTAGVTNSIGFMPCTLDGDLGADMPAAVEKVKAALADSKKDPYTGLYSLPLLDLAYKVFPHGIAQIAIRMGYKNPLIGMSNIGIIKPEEFVMGQAKLLNAWYTGATKYKPYMQLALTTFENAITFSIAIRGNDTDGEIFEKFLKKIICDLIEYGRSQA